jgi:hypothetical protein
MPMVAQASHWRHRAFTDLRPLLKGALVDAGLRLMASPRTGRLATQLVRRVVTTLVRRGGLADA